VNNRSRKKHSGRCPICGKGLYKTKEALLKKLGIEKEDIDGDVLTSEDVKKQYRELVKQFHPDKPGSDPEKFQEIREAKEELLEILATDGDIDLEKKPIPTQEDLTKARQAIHNLRQVNKTCSSCPYCHQKH